MYVCVLCACVYRVKTDSGTVWLMGVALNFTFFQFEFYIVGVAGLLKLLYVEELLLLINGLI